MTEPTYTPITAESITAIGFTADAIEVRPLTLEEMRPFGAPTRAMLEELLAIRADLMAQGLQFTYLFVARYPGAPKAGATCYGMPCEPAPVVGITLVNRARRRE